MSALAVFASELAQAREAIQGRVRGIDPDDFPALRRAYDAFSERDPTPELAGDSDFMLGGVSCLGVLPKGSDGNRVIFWLHGGGFTMGSPRSHRGVAAQVAAGARAAAVIPNYRLAPEHKFPAALEDAVAAFKAVVAEGVPADQIVMAGDSAGGGLAVQTALSLREEGGPMPIGLMLLSPWVDYRNSGWSYEAKAMRDPFITKPGLDTRARQYLGDATPKPILDEDLRGLPPVMIQVGEAEVLLSDSVSLAERMGAAGVPVTLEIWPEMFHVFQARYAMLKQGWQAVERLGQWAGAHIGPMPAA